MILTNITVPLDDHCLSVNCDIEIIFEEDTHIHPDDKIKIKLESRAVANINWIRYVLFGERDFHLPCSFWQAFEEELETAVLVELEIKSIDELKVM